LATREIRATTLIDSLNESLIPLASDLPMILEYYSSNRLKSFPKEPSCILWIDFKDNLSIKMITIYFGLIAQDVLQDLVNQIFTIGGDSIQKASLWTSGSCDVEIVECSSRRCH
jgi:hypothetical protein